MLMLLITNCDCERLLQWEDFLEMPLKRWSVHKLVKATNSDKPTSPSSFSLWPFLKVRWDMIKEDTMQVFHDFHVHCKFEIAKMVYRKNQGWLILKITGV